MESMNKEAVEYVRGIPVVKVFQQTVYSFKTFYKAIIEYKKSITSFVNLTFIFLIPSGRYFNSR